MNKCHLNTELSSHEGTRCQFNGGRCTIKSAEGRIRPVCGLGIDVHQDFYVVVEQVGGTNPKPQRFGKQAFLHWAAQLKEKTRAPRYTRFMKRAGLVFLCSAISQSWGSSATWSVRKNWMSTTSG